MSEIVKHYMWKDGETENSPTGTNDLGVRFPGLLYASCTGLNDKGKRTNVVVESYADSDGIRTWQGTDVAREATDLTLTLYFIGDSRQRVYDSFCEYIANGKIYYWDNMRKKLAYFILVDALKPKEDIYKGSTPYIHADFKLQNIWGECKEETF